MSGGCVVGVVFFQCKLFFFEGDVGGKVCVLIVLIVGSFIDDVLSVVSLLKIVGVKIIVVGMGSLFVQL